jgi:hypothetical protein
MGGTGSPASDKGKIVFAQVIHNAGVGPISWRMLYGWKLFSG